ncbi:hypothetical protein V8F33_004146 [Rhypophila sp. PSN 637]
MPDQTRRETKVNHRKQLANRVAAPGQGTGETEDGGNRPLPPPPPLPPLPPPPPKGKGKAKAKAEEPSQAAEEAAAPGDDEEPTAEPAEAKKPAAKDVIAVAAPAAGPVTRRRARLEKIQLEPSTWNESHWSRVMNHSDNASDFIFLASGLQNAIPLVIWKHVSLVVFPLTQLTSSLFFTKSVISVTSLNTSYQSLHSIFLTTDSRQILWEGFMWRNVLLVLTNHIQSLAKPLLPHLVFHGLALEVLSYSLTGTKSNPGIQDKSSQLPKDENCASRRTRHSKSPDELASWYSVSLTPFDLCASTSPLSKFVIVHIPTSFAQTPVSRNKMSPGASCLIP